ncbi:MAG: response regulator transcription factor [Pseudomonadota bacterium]
MTSDPTGAHILVVDDDPKVRLLLRRCFEPEGYRVSEAKDGASALARLGDGVDLVTLDLNLGADDGLTVAREIQARSDVPIVMVTGKGDVIDRVVGLELGADDYISKPFHVREVLARIRTVIRRSRSVGGTGSNTASSAVGSAAPQGFSFSGWTVDFGTLEVTDPSGSAVSLTTGELKLLEMFLNAPGRVLNRDMIMDLTKGHDWSPTDRSIDNQIARLRKKIENDPKSPRLIKTVRGAGYCFTADVKKT